MTDYSRLFDDLDLDDVAALLDSQTKKAMERFIENLEVVKGQKDEGMTVLGIKKEQMDQLGEQSAGLRQLARKCIDLTKTAREQSTEEFGPTGSPQFLGSLESNFNQLMDVLSHIQVVDDQASRDLLENYERGCILQDKDETTVKLSDLYIANPLGVMRAISHLSNFPAFTLIEGEESQQVNPCPYPEFNEECHLVHAGIHGPDLSKLRGLTEDEICPVIREEALAAQYYLLRLDRDYPHVQAALPGPPPVYILLSLIASWRCFNTPGCMLCGISGVLFSPILGGIWRFMSAVLHGYIQQMLEVISTSVGMLYLTDDPKGYLRYRAAMQAAIEHCAITASMELCRRAAGVPELILERWYALAESKERQEEAHANGRDYDVKGTSAEGMGFSIMVDATTIKILVNLMREALGIGCDEEEEETELEETEETEETEEVEEDAGEEPDDQDPSPED